MSVTLEAFWSLTPPANQTVFAESVEYVARGGRSRHFFFFGGGGGGSIFVIALAVLIAGGRFLVKNPDKARQLKDRLKGARGQQPGPFNPYQHPTANPYQQLTAGRPDLAPLPYAPPNPPGTQALGLPAAWPPSPGPASPYGSRAATNPYPLTPPTYGSAAAATNGSGRLPQPPPNTDGIPAVASSHPPVDAMRFNPPPNWPVPHGWAPGPGRQPDPSWPPAPTGWRFWVPQDTPA